MFPASATSTPSLQPPFQAQCYDSGVYIDNALSDDDLHRITQEEITPLVVAGAHVSVLEACDVLCQEILIPFIQQTANRPQRQVRLTGLLYRMLGLPAASPTLSGTHRHETVRLRAPGGCGRPAPRPGRQRPARGAVWVDWFNTRRLLGPIGDIPPAEYEARYYQQAAVA